ncbi:MAG: hypothetical protein NUV77_14870 [Thermoguttaceae bacterium]|jgi:hypothetical protein|nr:hypothetical protein [Thermoguttaceae bacterium]
MHEWPAYMSAVEAVQCLFLARELRKQGQAEAAARWEARAAAWLGRNGPASTCASTTSITPQPTKTSSEGSRQLLPPNQPPPANGKPQAK